MFNRKMKKSFPLNEFSILFSETVNNAIKKNEGFTELLGDYPNKNELLKIVSEIGKSLMIIVNQEQEDKAQVIDKKQYKYLVKQHPPESIKFLKRTGFRSDVLNGVKIQEQKIDSDTIIFISDSIFYRMLINGTALYDLKKYIEKNRSVQTSDRRNDPNTKINIFQNQSDVSFLKLKILVSAVVFELQNCKI